VETDCDTLESEVETLRWELAGGLARHRQLYEIGGTVARRIYCEFGELVQAELEARFIAEIHRDERNALAAAIASGEDWNYEDFVDRLEEASRKKAIEAHLQKMRLAHALEDYRAYLEQEVSPLYEGEGTRKLRRLFFLLHPYVHPERLPTCEARHAFSMAMFNHSTHELGDFDQSEAQALAFAATAEISPEWSLPEHLPQLAAELQRRIEHVREEIDLTLKTPPCDQLALLDDPEAMEARRATHLAAVEVAKAEAAEEKARLDALMGP